MDGSILAHNIYENGSIEFDTNSGGWNIDNQTVKDNGNWIGDNPLTIDNYYNNYWYPFVYPTVTYVPERSKIEQAFQILNKLMKKGVVKIDKVKTFVDLVMEISDCI